MTQLSVIFPNQRGFLHYLIQKYSGGFNLSVEEGESCQQYREKSRNQNISIYETFYALLEVACWLHVYKPG